MNSKYRLIIKIILTSIVVFITISIYVRNNYSQAQTITNGLIAYYALNGNANDGSGNNHHGSIVGNPTIIPGVRGQAFRFDGDDYIQINNSSDFEPGTGDYSVVAWVRYQPDATGQRILIIFDQLGSYRWIQMSGTPEDDIKFGLKSGTNESQTMVVHSPIKDNQWHLIVGVRESVNTVKLYVDGVLVDQITNPDLGDVQTTSSGSIYIGHDPHYGGYYNDGDIDELRIYNRALSDTEIQTLFDIERPKTVYLPMIVKNYDPNLIAYYALNGNADDSSGNNHHGSIVGNPTIISGVRGQAFRFDGDDYIQINNSSDFEPGTGDYSVVAWVRYQPDAYGQRVVAIFDQVGSFRWVHVAGDSDQDEIKFGLKSGTNESQTMTVHSPIKNNEWHLIVGVRENIHTVKLYIDGVLVDQLTNPNLGDVQTTSSGSIYIGYDPAYGGHYNDGDIDELRIYNRALSDTEIQTLFDTES